MARIKMKMLVKWCLKLTLSLPKTALTDVMQQQQNIHMFLKTKIIWVYGTLPAAISRKSNCVSSL